MSIAVIALVLSSCDKKQTVAPATTVPASTQTKVTSNPHARTGPVIKTRYRQLIRTLGDIKCASTNGNCLDDVIVKPTSGNKVVMQGLIDVIAGGNQEYIRVYFSNNSTVLSNYFGADDVTFVISGDETVTEEQNTGTKNYFISLTSGTDVIEVLPVSLNL